MGIFRVVLFAKNALCREVSCEVSVDSANKSAESARISPLILHKKERKCLQR